MLLILKSPIKNAKTPLVLGGGDVGLRSGFSSSPVMRLSGVEVDSASVRAVAAIAVVVAAGIAVLDR